MEISVKKLFAGLVVMCGLAAAAMGQTAADPFPPVDQKFFTASTPTTDTVNTFLKSQWGFDSARIWKVMAIQSTAAAGISKVTVFVTDTTPNAKVQSFSFFTTPDGNHAIVDGSGVIPFGAKPFEHTRKMMEDRADGAFHGAASKDLLLVEFADMQCPHCKTAQDTMKQIAADFPQARIVYQSFPLTNIHPSAFQAAAYGVCVQKAKNDAFFVYAQDVFEHQEALTAEGTTTVLNNAVTKAGLDPAAIAACAVTPATKATVDASTKLAEDAQVEQTPTLVVNGRLVTITEVPYESLKKMIQYQAAADGVK